MDGCLARLQSRRQFLEGSAAATVGAAAQSVLGIRRGWAAPPQLPVIDTVTLPLLAREAREIIPESEILYKAYLVPEKADLLRLGFSEDLATKTIYRVIDGGETPVHAAKPIAYDLIGICRQNGIPISPLMQSKLPTHDFYLVHFSCTFRSHDNSPHPYVWGIMEAALSTADAEEQPVAYELCPSMVMDAASVSDEYGLSPSLEFRAIKVDLGQVARTAIQFQELSPVVLSFGKLTPVAGWEYTTSRSRIDIRGNHDGFMIVKTPKGSRVKVTVDVRAKVEESFASAFVRAVSGKWSQEDFRGMQKAVLPLYRQVPVTEDELRSKRWRQGFADLIQNRSALRDELKTLMLGQ